MLTIAHRPASPTGIHFDSSAPNGQVVTFQGTSHARLTTAKAGDYFDNGSIAHFSHDIDDLYQFYSLANQDSRHPDGEERQGMEEEEPRGESGHPAEPEIAPAQVGELVAEDHRELP